VDIWGKRTDDTVITPFLSHGAGLISTVVWRIIRPTLPAVSSAMQFMRGFSRCHFDVLVLPA
jgi:hypothetical protein